MPHCGHLLTDNVFRALLVPVAFVEHIAFRWASKIAVTRDGDTLNVRGQDSSAETASPDVLREYRNFGAQAPHLQFANARTDEDLIAFVRRYGPVNGLLQTSGLLARGDSTLEVRESLKRLRREQMILASALEMFAGLRDGNDVDAANGLSAFVRACSQPGPFGDVRPESNWILDLLFRVNGDSLEKVGVSELETFLRRLEGESLKTYCWYVLCLVLRSFPPEIAPVKAGIAEIPPRNNAGVLPALIFMLRRDCLDGQEVRMCGQRECRKFFKVERGGQRFCSDECSRLERQRDYWHRKGKEARALRIAKKRKKVGEKSGTVQIPR